MRADTNNTLDDVRRKSTLWKIPHGPLAARDGEKPRAIPENFLVSGPVNAIALARIQAPAACVAACAPHD